MSDWTCPANVLLSIVLIVSNVTGGRIVIVTSAGFIMPLFFSSMSAVPSIAIGTMGTSASMARRTLPALKLWTGPPLLLVPSNAETQ